MHDVHCKAGCIRVEKHALQVSVVVVFQLDCHVCKCQHVFLPVWQHRVTGAAWSNLWRRKESLVDDEVS